MALRRSNSLWIAVFTVAATAGAAHAYVGPGAGFAVVTSFFIWIAVFFAVLGTLLMWPFRMVMLWIRRRKISGKAKAKRLVILGLDGVDPGLLKKWMDEGHLSNFKKLSDEGHFSELATTYPSVSPVAWSSFMSGVTPAKHGIYDFLARDKKSYLPVLSSADIGPPTRTFKLGKYRIPLSGPSIRLLRKSQPFWKILGDHGIFSAILRVPITFPPEKFRGVLLSGMCVPDLLGTQGTFIFFTTRKEGSRPTGGEILALEKTGNGEGYTGKIPGPADSMLEGAPQMFIPFTLIPKGNGDAQLNLPDQKLQLKRGVYSEWTPLTFKGSFNVKARGISRVMLTESGDETSLYISPINIDPSNPALPISHPFSYASYLAKMQDVYATLGLAEDTWALNEGVLDDSQFLEQTYLNHRERETMFFDALEKVDKGVVACVFDTTDRIQHMFFRYLDPEHPALVGKDRGKHADAVFDLYKRMDDLLGRTRAKMKKGDELIVMSDHGFNSFRYGVNLNAWLLKNGYLHIKPGADPQADWLRSVDWSKTKAYALGLTGMYLNMAGREINGIVPPEQAGDLKKELIEKLSGLKDDRNGQTAIMEIFDRDKLFFGPYRNDAPDLILGFNRGYRSSWDCSLGRITPYVFDDNVKAWSGDHAIDPRLAPGILVTTLKVKKNNPGIIDIAPTALDLFGVTAPGYMDGASLLRESQPAKGAAS